MPASRTGVSSQIADHWTRSVAHRAVVSGRHPSLPRNLLAARLAGDFNQQFDIPLNQRSPSLNREPAGGESKTAFRIAGMS